jgi:hypothetical protein
MGKKIYTDFKTFTGTYLKESNKKSTNESINPLSIGNIEDTAIKVREVIEKGIRSFKTEKVQEDIMIEIGSLLLEHVRKIKANIQPGDRIDFEAKKISKAIYSIMQNYDSPNDLDPDFDLKVKSSIFKFEKEINNLLDEIQDEKFEQKIIKTILNSIIQAQRDQAKNQTKSLFEFSYDLEEKLVDLRAERARGRI